MLKNWVRIVFLFCFFSPLAAEDISGFWQSIDKKTKKANSVIAFYTYEGKLYGKIIATYNKDGNLIDTIYHPVDRAPGVAGNPYYCGLDIVWDAKPDRDGDKYYGYVINPKKGDVYDAEIWKRGDSLVLRGKLLVFGKNVTFPPFPEENFTPDFKKPDLSTFTPNTPQK